MGAWTCFSLSLKTLNLNTQICQADIDFITNSIHKAHCSGWRETKAASAVFILCSIRTLTHMRSDTQASHYISLYNKIQPCTHQWTSLTLIRGLFCFGALGLFYLREPEKGCFVCAHNILIYRMGAKIYIWPLYGVHAAARAQRPLTQKKSVRCWKDRSSRGHSLRRANFAPDATRSDWNNRLTAPCASPPTAQNFLQSSCKVCVAAAAAMALHLSRKRALCLDGHVRTWCTSIKTNASTHLFVDFLRSILIRVESKAALSF